MCYIPDPIERGEARAEASMAKMEEGTPAEHLRCLCGRVAPANQFEPVNADPYAILACPDCCEEMWARRK